MPAALNDSLYPPIGNRLYISIYSHGLDGISLNSRRHVPFHGLR